MPYNNVVTKIPRQKLPKSQKDDEWAKKSVDAFISLSRFSRGYYNDNFAEKLYEYYNGEIDHGDYTHITKPFGETRQNFPAKLHNYNIIKPVVDTLVGEKVKRPVNYSVVNSSPDAISAKKEAYMTFKRKAVYSEYINALNEMGIPTGQDDQPVPSLDSLQEIFEEKYTDVVALRGQKSLDYMNHFLEIDDKFTKGWYHFLISGSVASYRDVTYDEPIYEILNPLDVDGDKDPDIDFLEDGDWVAHRKIAYPSSVIDHYYDELTDEQVARLENPRGSFDMQFATRSGADFASLDRIDSYERRDRAIEIMRVYWKSRKKIGFVNYTDRFGRVQTKTVQEGYKPSPDETIEWEWVNEVWEGHRIDGDIYVRLQPFPNQRLSLDNPAICKLPINGRNYSDLNADNISLVAMGIPYQLSYNIYKYRLDLAVAKSKDRVAQFDINMIPKKWDPEDFMYWVETTGIAWVDYNKEDIKLSPQHQSVMDLTIQTIDKYIMLLQAIVTEWERISGVNSQRQGIVGEHAGKGTTQQAIVQSSNITEDMFRKYMRFEQRDLQALIDHSKIAWIDGKKSQYILHDGLSEIDIDGPEHMNSEYGVFVSGDGRDVEKIDLIRQLVQPMIQNGASMKTVAEIINSDSFAEISAKIKEAERKAQELQKAQQEAAQQAAQAEREFEIMKEDREDARVAAKNATDIEVAMIRSDNNQSGDKDKTIEQRKLSLEEREMEADSRLEREKIEEDKRSNRADEDLKRMKIKADKAKQSATSE